MKSCTHLLGFRSTDERPGASAQSAHGGPAVNHRGAPEAEDCVTSAISSCPSRRTKTRISVAFGDPPRCRCCSRRSCCARYGAVDQRVADTRDSSVDPSDVDRNPVCDDVAAYYAAVGLTLDELIAEAHSFRGRHRWLTVSTFDSVTGSID